MSYQMPTTVPTMTINAPPKDRTAAVLGLTAAVLYVAAYFSPLLTVGGESNSMGDGDNKMLWLWVVPGLLAAIAGGLGLVGKGVGAALSVGLDLGMAGLTIFEMIVVHKATDLSVNDGFGLVIEKGVGFWMFCAAAVLSVIAAMTLSLGRSPGDAKCDHTLSVLAGLALAGVSLAVLLPANGFSVLDIDDTLVQFGFIIWGVLAPLFALLMAFSHTRTAVAFVLGVGIAHVGLSLAILQDIGVSGGSVTGSLTTSHPAILHTSVLASVVLAGLALGRVVQAVAPVARFAPYAPGPVGAPTPYQPPVQPEVRSQWAADPYGRHQFRLWDGHTWSASVSDNGIVGNDPV
ncbi:unannotated protein [freshwater metagenome]|uniref:Unannotated protein n=1 Tax=freshwater metagenome TaxID=449393 RepID=A0A6J6S2R5_9ZZZZ